MAAGLPAQWEDRHRLWNTALPGPGHGSPVIAGEKVFVTCGDEKTAARLALCFAARDGRLLWQRAFGGEKHRKHEDNGFASATPAVDGSHLYLTWANPREYLVVCLDHDGHEVWRTDLGPYRSGHGSGASPIVHDDLLIVPDQQDGTSRLLAFDRRSGKPRWEVPRRSRASYATPCIHAPADAPVQLVVTSYEHGVSSIDPKTGKLLWELDVFDKGHVETAIASPVVAGDLIYASCGWLGVRQEVVAVRAAGNSGRKIFALDRSAPLCTTPLVHDGLLYLWSERGIVTCADAATGAVHWRERVSGTYYSSPLALGEFIGNVSREGEFVVVAAGKRFALLAANPLGAGSHSTPAVSGGRLFIRTFTHLVCVGRR